MSSSKRLKTGINEELRKESKEESNQILSTNNSNQMDLSMANQSTSFDLTLNLSSSLKSDIINALIKFSYFLKGQTIKANDKKDLFNVNIQLMKRLSILKSDNEGDLKDDLDKMIIDGASEDGDLFFEFNPTTRRDIIDQLTRNFSSIFLCKSTESKKKKLIKENNEMVSLLLDLVVKTAKADENNNASTDNLSTRTINSETEMTKKLEEKIKEMDDYLKEKNREVNFLRSEMIDISANNNPIIFQFEIKNVRDLLKSPVQIQLRSKTFNFLSLPWNLVFKTAFEFNNTKYIQLYLELNFDLGSKFMRTDNLSIEVDLKLFALHPSNPDLNRSHLGHHVFEKRESFGSSRFISYNEIAEFIKDDALKVGAEIRARKINKL